MCAARRRCPGKPLTRCAVTEPLLALQILIDGFAISSLYGLGAVGFTLMFGVCGVLNLAHGGIMLIAALFGWWVAADYGAGPYGGAAVGVLAGLVASYVTYFVVVRPFQRSRAIPRRRGDLPPHRHAALGHHDPGRHGLSVQRQPRDACSRWSQGS